MQRRLLEKERMILKTGLPEGKGVLAGKQQCAVCCSSVLLSHLSCSSAACPGVERVSGEHTRLDATELKDPWLEGNRWRKRQSGCLHTWGLGLFLFTKAGGPGMLLVPHLLLDVLLATVAKIVLSPSVSAQRPLPQALFSKLIVPPSPLCMLPLRRCGV